MLWQGRRQSDNVEDARGPAEEKDASDACFADSLPTEPPDKTTKQPETVFSPKDEAKIAALAKQLALEQQNPSPFLLEMQIVMLSSPIMYPNSEPIVLAQAPPSASTDSVAGSSVPTTTGSDVTEDPNRSGSSN